jgi:hypothetical protein
VVAGSEEHDPAYAVEPMADLDQGLPLVSSAVYLVPSLLYQ